MAIVLRAWDQQEGVARAVKLLKPATARRAGLRRRFRLEARTLRKLEHPNIVRVLDVGEEGELPWLVMEIVDGGSLDKRVNREGPLDADAAHRLALELLSALGCAHAAGIVHRDVKPGNVLLRADGRAVLTDFGLLRDEVGGPSRTRTGVQMGTPAYMAPEQRISARRADRRADLYGLAATLFAATTGEDPFDLSGTALSSAMLDGVPLHLHEPIHVATRANPDDRYQTAAEMAAAIEASRAHPRALKSAPTTHWPSDPMQVPRAPEPPATRPGAEPAASAVPAAPAPAAPAAPAPTPPPATAPVPWTWLLAGVVLGFGLAALAGALLFLAFGPSAAG